MPETILAVLRALVDAAFRSGGITDVAHAALHGKINEQDEAVQNAPPPALTEAEEAELERLQAKQEAAHAPVVADPAPVGTEATGFHG